MQPTEQVHALLAIRHAGVLGGKDRSIEHRLTPVEIQSVVPEIGFSLPLVPCHHAPIVATKSCAVNLRKPSLTTSSPRGGPWLVSGERRTRPLHRARFAWR
jgi:hypothetical protein